MASVTSSEEEAFQARPATILSRAKQAAKKASRAIARSPKKVLEGAAKLAKTVGRSFTGAPAVWPPGPAEPLPELEAALEALPEPEAEAGPSKKKGSSQAAGLEDLLSCTYDELVLIWEAGHTSKGE